MAVSRSQPANLADKSYLIFSTEWNALKRFPALARKNPYYKPESIPEPLRLSQDEAIPQPGVTSDCPI